VIDAVDTSVQVSSQVAGRTVLFFDGACGVCDRLVRFFLKRDRAGRLVFAPLQGSTARSLLPPATLAGDLLSTVLVLTDTGTLLSRSRAVGDVLRRLGGGWRILGLLIGLVPTALGDAVYAWFARNRHRFFGPPACHLLGRDDRARILD
jgi:predicted DCC family thiol-disulfide oxidoreductase YuxK